MGTKLASKLNERQDEALAPAGLSEQDDATLIAAADSGAKEAFEILVRRHRARILRVALRFTRNHEDAEDIAQQTFQKAFVHLRQFEGNSSFSTWLTRIAINEALMWSRRKRSLSEVSLETLNIGNKTVVPLDPPDLAPNPEEACLELDRKRFMSAAINRLRPAVRRAIELRHLGELSIEETAGLMGLSVGTVKARLFRGRWKLHAMLKRNVGSASSLRTSTNEQIAVDRDAAVIVWDSNKRRGSVLTN